MAKRISFDPLHSSCDDLTQHFKDCRIDFNHVYPELKCSDQYLYSSGLFPTKDSAVLKFAYPRGKRMTHEQMDQYRQDVTDVVVSNRRLLSHLHRIEEDLESELERCSDPETLHKIRQLMTRAMNLRRDIFYNMNRLKVIHQDSGSLPRPIVPKKPPPSKPRTGNWLTPFVTKIQNDPTYDLSTGVTFDVIQHWDQYPKYFSPSTNLNKLYDSAKSTLSMVGIKPPKHKFKTKSPLKRVLDDF